MVPLKNYFFIFGFKNSLFGTSSPFKCFQTRPSQLLNLQVQKAQIEKAEIKADMTKERLELSQDLLLERERARNLEETVRLLKEQAEIYQVKTSISSQKEVALNALKSQYLS